MKIVFWLLLGVTDLLQKEFGRDQMAPWLLWWEKTTTSLWCLNFKCRYIYLYILCFYFHHIYLIYLIKLVCLISVVYLDFLNLPANKKLWTRNLQVLITGLLNIYSFLKLLFALFLQNIMCQLVVRHGVRVVSSISSWRSCCVFSQTPCNDYTDRLWENRPEGKEL